MRVRQRTRGRCSAILAFLFTASGRDMNLKTATCTRIFSHCLAYACRQYNLTLNLHPPYSTTMHTSEYDYLFKLLLIGDSGVGKVCGCLRRPCCALGADSCTFITVL